MQPWECLHSIFCMRLPSHFRGVKPYLLAVLLIGACRRDQPSGSVSQRVAAAVGCYELTSSTSYELDEGTLRRFRLRAESVSPQRPLLHRVDLLGPRDSLEATFVRLRLWRVDSLSDTVRVQAGDGFAAQFFAGVPNANGDLIGVSGASGDVGPPFEHNVHLARSRRIACP